MAFVNGNSESVRALQSLFNLTMTAIEQDTEKLEKYKKNIMNSWRDERVGELEEIISQIKKALADAQESKQAVSNALNAYASFLEQK